MNRFTYDSDLRVKFGMFFLQELKEMVVFSDLVCDFPLSCVQTCQLECKGVMSNTWGFAHAKSAIAINSKLVSPNSRQGILYTNIHNIVSDAKTEFRRYVLFSS